MITEGKVFRKTFWPDSMKFSLFFSMNGKDYPYQTPLSSPEDWGLMMNSMSVFIARVGELLKDELRDDKVLGFSLKPFCAKNDKGEPVGVRFGVDVTLGRRGKRGGVAIEQSLGQGQFDLASGGFVNTGLLVTGCAPFCSAEEAAKVVASILKGQM